MADRHVSNADTRAGTPRRASRLPGPRRRPWTAVGPRHRPGHDILGKYLDFDRWGTSLEGQTLARRIVEIASDKLASDIVLLDIRQIATVADYFVVCSTASERQMQAVVRDLEKELRDEGLRPLRVEGKSASGWVLIDYGDVVVHVFSADQRTFYRLEELWSAAVPLVRMQ